MVRDKKLVGIVTDRDLRDAPEALAVSAKVAGADKQAVLPDPVEIHVESVMTPNVVVLSPEDTVERAAQLMVNDRIGGVLGS